jgi:uncharacterized protein
LFINILVSGEKFMANTGKYAAGGKKIVCSHCGGDEFAKNKALLNTAWMNLPHLEWRDKTPIMLTCTQCSNIQWFLKEPEQQS